MGQTTQPTEKVHHGNLPFVVLAVSNISHDEFSPKWGLLSSNRDSRERRALSFEKRLNSFLSPVCGELQAYVQ
jgi:hypothetical protein